MYVKARVLRQGDLSCGSWKKGSCQAEERDGQFYVLI